MSKTVKYGGGFLVLVFGGIALYWLIDTLGYILGAIAALFCLGLIAKFIEAYKEAAAPTVSLVFYTDKSQIKSQPKPTIGASYRFDLEAVGEASYKSKMQRLLPKNIQRERKFRVYALFTLLPETNNPYDKHAVAVHLEGNIVAYVAREDAELYRKKYEDVSHSAWGVIVGGRGKTAGVWLDAGEDPFY